MPGAPGPTWPSPPSKALIVALGLVLAAACSRSTPPSVPVTPAPPTPAATPAIGPTPGSGASGRAPSDRPSPPVARPTPTPGPLARLGNTLAEANRAYARGEVTRAAELYRAVLQAGAGQPADPATRRVLAFARFRLGLTALLAGDEPRGRRALQEEFRGEADDAFREMAFQLWDTYAMTADLAAACERVTAFARQRQVRVDAAPALRLAPEQICVLPSSRATAAPSAPDTEGVDSGPPSP